MDFPYILKQKKPNVGISKFDYTLYQYITDCFILENSAYPDEMPHKF